MLNGSRIPVDTRLFKSYEEEKNTEVISHEETATKPSYTDIT